jgi:N-acetylglucosamine transport system substrate-binding protein
MRLLSGGSVLAGLAVVSAAALLYVDFAPAPGSGGGGRAGAGRRPRVLDIMYFHGGFGVEFIEDVGRQFESLHPDVRVKIWASPRIAEKIRLRLLSGDPPDIFFPGWGLDVDRVVEAALLYDIQPDLNRPPVAGAGTAPAGGVGAGQPWEKDFYPGIFDRYRFDGRTYGVPFFYSTSVFWYNKGLFDAHGWKPPATWGEFADLCERIKAAGVAPIALQGRYIGYLREIFLSMLDRLEEPGFVESANMLKGGYWTRPSVVDVAGRIQDLFRKGYFQTGCLGMSHTEAQMEFLQGRAAMVWCGTWFTSEMRDVIPKGFRYSCFGPPGVPGGKGDPTMLAVQSEYAFVCQAARNRELAMEFLKFMCSPNVAERFVKGRQALTGMPAANRDAPESLRPVVELLQRARSFRTPTAHGNPYPSWEFVVNSCLIDLVTRPSGGETFRQTPRQFAEELERRAEELRKEKAEKQAASPPRN